jgi:hypothetical protein
MMPLPPHKPMSLQKVEAFAQSTRYDNKIYAQLLFAAWSYDPPKL